MVDKEFVERASRSVQGWARRIFWPRESYVRVSNGATSADKPIILDKTGKLDASLLDGEDIADIVGAMVTGNTETGIAVTYQDADNTIDFDAQTAGDARYLKQDGTTPLTANWDAGAFSILSSGFQARSGGNLNLRSQDGLTRWQVDANGDLIGYVDIGGGSVNDHSYQVMRQPASVTRLQTITIELVSVAAVLVWNTYFDIGLARNGNTTVFGWATGRVTWQNPNSAIAATILSSDLASNSSGTTTVTVTAITNGISIAFGGGDFLNTLDRNSVIVRTLGYDAIRPAVTITIA